MRQLTSPPLRRLAAPLLLVCLAAVAGLPLHAQEAKTPDVIVFTNGDQLTGTLVKAVGDTVTFKSDMAGEISVPLAKIKELRSSGNFAVFRKDRPLKLKEPVRTGTVSLEGGDLKVIRSSAPVETVPSAQLSYIVDEATYNKALHNSGSFLRGWDGAITAGATLIRATQTGTTVTSGVALVRQIPGVPYLPSHSRTVLNLSQSYGKLDSPFLPPATPASSVKTNIFHADAEYDRYFSQRFYALVDTAFDHNYSQGLELQQSFGGGIGATVFQSPVQQLDVKAELHYEEQRFVGGVGNGNLIGGTFGENYRRSLPLKLVFTETGTVTPAFNNTNAYSAHAVAALAIPAYKRLNFSVSAQDDYLHNPPFGYKNNSFQFITGITYSLR